MKISIDFIGLLTVAFIVLKLLDKIDWSWWWVLSPLWLPIAVVLGIVIVTILIGLMLLLVLLLIFVVVEKIAN